MRLSKVFIALAVVGAPLILAACGAGAAASSGNGDCLPKGVSSAAAAQPISVISDPTTLGSYDPRTVTISAGQSVRWTFQDQSVQHSVTADDESFDSCLQDAGFGFTVTFSRPGTYAYHCSIHAQMTGRVIVA